MWKKIINILFPKFCVNCNKEGAYLCQDCFSLIPILKHQPEPLLFCSASYNNFIVRKLINQFKYEPFIKGLAKPLASLIIAHLLSLEKFPDLRDFILVPVPLHKKKLKQRGFNQAEEIGKEVAGFLNLPLINNALIKIKRTPSQVGLEKEKRKQNVKGVFLCQKPKLVKNKKILLIDDVCTTGATFAECQQCLLAGGASVVLKMCVAHG